MEDSEKDAPEHVDIEHEPTISWEPGSAADSGEDSSGKLTGAFAWALTVEGGAQSGLTYVLGPGNTIAGRGAEAAIFLPDVTVSREHVRFSVDSSGLSMSDLASTNGTYVNGHRLTAGMLEEGDQLMVGKFHLRISRGHD